MWYKLPVHSHSPLRVPLPFAMAEQSTVAAVAALQASLVPTNISLDYFESEDVGFFWGSKDLGRVDASVSVSAHGLVVYPLCKRVQAGAEARFRIKSEVRQEPDSCAAASVEGIARVLRSEAELVFGGLANALQFCVACATGGETPVGCVDLIVAVPKDAALGSEVVLRRVSLAGCDVPLGEATVRVIIGFNHEPVPAGRVWAAAIAGDIPALAQALAGGCSTQETDEVRSVCLHELCLRLSHLWPPWFDV
jgi:hypothetical protein